MATPGAASAAAGRYSYTGDAYGTKVSVGSTVKSGPTALVTLGCGTGPGVHKSNTAADLNLLPTLFSGTVRTTADTTTGPTQSRTTAETERVNLLGGLITADLVRAVSSTTRDSSGFHTSADGSSLLNLVVAGHPEVAVNPAPNTRVDLLGIGYVVLNEQVRRVSTKKASLTVNMIHLHITTVNLLGIAVGTDVIVSHAKSDLEGPVSGFLDGKAYGTSAKVGTLVRSGPSALVVMPCLGTNGVLKTNEVALVDVPGLVTSGTVYDTAQGTVTDTSASGETTSTIQKVNVLNGLVTADVVKADAHASSDGTTPTFSDAGSSLLNLSIAGHPEITADAAPNTKVSLLGLGTLYIHRVIHHPDSIEVRMIELAVTQFPNSLGLALGTNVKVAVAEASVH